MPLQPLCRFRPPRIHALGHLLHAMLKPSDLETFVALVRRANRETPPSPQAGPDTLLRADPPSDGLLHPNELGRLQRSLQIASHLGDIPDSAPPVLHTIVQELSDEGFSYLSLERSTEWLDAIVWALAQSTSSASDSLPQPELDREFIVGTACQALRDRDYRLDITALGPRIDDEARNQIAQEVDSLFAKIGGLDVLQQLCWIIRETGKVHDGMWLLGNVPAGIGGLPQRAVPFGWLLSIALRNIHVTPSADDSAQAWTSAINLALDFSAGTDCQRYNPFDGFALSAPDFLPQLEESLTWRELFTLPQVPPSVLPILRNAFAQIEWPNGTEDLQGDVDRLFGELVCLQKALSDDRLTLMRPRTVRKRFPLLWRHARALPGKVNTGYLDPFGGKPRDHDRYVFFLAYDDRVVVLPSSLTAAAGCEAIFRLVWAKAASSEAERIVADTIEKSVALACRNAHAAKVWEKARYRVGGSNFEIDIAVRDGQEIVLFETKAKSLTSKARSGDLMAFISDYTNSFLGMLRQLVRHDRHLHCGLTPLTLDEGDLTALRVIKVAVSPLSYGPASDHVLTNALMHAMAQARLVSQDGAAEDARIIDAFNRALERSIEGIDQVAPRHDGRIDMVRYLMGVFWFDLGQLLYTLNRGRSVVDAVSVLRNITFSTRDFWTEAASIDRRGLSGSRWRPL